MQQILNSANFPFQIFNTIGQALLQSSKFLFDHIYPFITTWTLVGWCGVLSLINTDSSIPALKTLPGQGFSPDPSCSCQNGLGSRLPLYRQWNLHVSCPAIHDLYWGGRGWLGTGLLYLNI